MTKKELLKEIEAVANEKQANVNGKQVEAFYNAVFECLKKATVAEGKLPVSDVGVFTVKTRQARKGHNPKTGESIEIPESKTITFKPSKAWKESL